MFSGIIEELAAVVEAPVGGNMQLSVLSKLDHSKTRIGDSIAVNGVCLTVVAKDSALHFDLTEETLRKTTLGKLSPRQSVNIERSIAIGDRLHGHFVAGHVDQVVRLIEKRTEQGGFKLIFQRSLPQKIELLAPKGSVALDGVSLTVGEVLDDNFSVYIIPHTAASTTLGMLEAGGEVNLEYDILARYVSARQI